MSARNREFYLVAGARRGIGRALVATFLARSGVTVVAAIRNGSEHSLQEFSDLSKGELTELVTVQIDSTSDDDALKAVRLLREKYHITHLDTVIANAGIGTTYSNAADSKAADIDFLFSASANASTSVTAVPFCLGTISEGREAFKTILDIGYTSDGTAELPYNQWNAWADPFCSQGERKPLYGVPMKNLEGKTFWTVYNDFKTFVQANPNARNTSLLAEICP
ncbi:MAG: hypothetical protein M1820_009025 [Bogoriella megaspora]|nr:MAG: hypothetical protein M1820_009025 [Bogoriella megaspora]